LWYYLGYINRKVNLSNNLWTSFTKTILFGSIIYYFVQLASSVLTQNNGMNYWPLIVQGIILIGGIFMIYIASITEFRALLFNDVLKFLAKRKQ
jgi:hypothetical protein